MVFLLIVVAADMQVEACWNGAQRAQWWQKAWLKVRREQRDLMVSWVFKLCFLTRPTGCLDQLDIVLAGGVAAFLLPINKSICHGQSHCPNSPAFVEYNFGPDICNKTIIHLTKTWLEEAFKAWIVKLIHRKHEYEALRLKLIKI